MPDSARAMLWRTLCEVLVALTDSVRSADILRLRCRYNDAPREGTEQFDILVETVLSRRLPNVRAARPRIRKILLRDEVKARLHNND